MLFLISCITCSDVGLSACIHGFAGGVRHRCESQQPTSSCGLVLRVEALPFRSKTCAALPVRLLEVKLVRCHAAMHVEALADSICMHLHTHTPFAYASAYTCATHVGSLKRYNTIIYVISIKYKGIPYLQKRALVASCSSKGCGGQQKSKAVIFRAFPPPPDRGRRSELDCFQLSPKHR